jgi:hypothetical protein
VRRVERTRAAVQRTRRGRLGRRSALVLSAASLVAHAEQTARAGAAPGREPDCGSDGASAQSPSPASAEQRAPCREVEDFADPWYSSGLFGTDPREPVYLPVGLLVSWPFQRAVGIGAEATLDVYHQRKWHWGLVAQAEYEAAPGTDRGRFALGPQFGVPYLGVETAVALRTGTGERSTSLLPQLAPYASSGFVAVALRITGPGLAVDGSEKPAWPAELALVLTLKWPLSLQSDLYCSGSALYCMPGAPRPPP